MNQQMKGVTVLTLCNCNGCQGIQALTVCEALQAQPQSYDFLSAN